MSEHELTDEQREIRALARRFAQEEIAPHAAAWDREHRFPHEVFARLGELGLMGACVPVEHGGAGADFLSYVLALEELARADAGVAVTVAVHTSAATLPLLAHGTRRADRAGSCRRSRRGIELGAFALTEPEAGSDAAALRTRADADGRITGAKQFITTGVARPRPARLRPRPRRPHHRAYVVRRPAPGLTVSKEEEKLGLNSSTTAALSFDAVAGERLGAAGRRHADRARARSTAGASGSPRRRSGSRRRRSTSRRLRERAQRVRRPDRPLRADPAEARRHADGDRGGARAHLARRAAQAGRPAAHGRGRAGEAVRLRRRAPADGRGDPGARRLRLHEGLPAERYYRDAKVTEIYEGTSEIQRLVIARACSATPLAPPM